MNEAYREQVRLMLDLLPFIAEESIFALKGGTAINFFVRDMPRLSVDIDLTYLPLEDCAAVFNRRQQCRPGAARACPTRQPQRSPAERVADTLAARIDPGMRRVSSTRRSTPSRRRAAERCLSCHGSTAPHSECPAAPSTSDCTTCHMPKVEVQPHLRFTDHWIRVRDDENR